MCLNSKYKYRTLHGGCYLIIKKKQKKQKKKKKYSLKDLLSTHFFYKQPFHKQRQTEIGKKPSQC